MKNLLRQLMGCFLAVSFVISSSMADAFAGRCDVNTYGFSTYDVQFEKELFELLQDRGYSPYNFGHRDQVEGLSIWLNDEMEALDFSIPATLRLYKKSELNTHEVYFHARVSIPWLSFRDKHVVQKKAHKKLLRKLRKELPSCRLDDV